MTLTSHFRTDAPINPIKLHLFATSLVNPTGQEVSTDLSKLGEIWNTPGQGLEAWVWTLHGDGGDLLADEPYEFDPDDWTRAEYDEYVERTREPLATVDVAFDSPYGYSDDQGRSCTQFHAELFFALNDFVMNEYPDANNYWLNEYAGTWHRFDDYEGWLRFAGDGVGAKGWFVRVVSPLIHKAGGELFFRNDLTY